MTQTGTYKIRLNPHEPDMLTYVRVFFTVKHTETNESMVLYVKFDGDGTLWVMPEKLFTERCA